MTDNTIDEGVVKSSNKEKKNAHHLQAGTKWADKFPTSSGKKMSTNFSNDTLLHLGRKNSQEETDMSDETNEVLEQEDEMTVEEILSDGPASLFMAIQEGDKDLVRDIFDTTLAAKVQLALDDAKEVVASEMFETEEVESFDNLQDFFESYGLEASEEGLEEVAESITTELNESDYPLSSHELMVKNKNSDMHMHKAQERIHHAGNAKTPAERTAHLTAAANHARNAAIAAIHSDKARGISNTAASRNHQLKKFAGSIKTSTTRGPKPKTGLVATIKRKASAAYRGLMSSTDLEELLGLEGITEEIMDQIHESPDDIETILGIELSDEQLSLLAERGLWKPKEHGFKGSGVAPTRHRWTKEGNKDSNEKKRDKSFPKRDATLSGTAFDSNLPDYLKRAKLNNETEVEGEVVTEEAIEPLTEASGAGRHHEVYAELVSRHKRFADGVADSFMRGEITDAHHRDIMKHHKHANARLILAHGRLGSTESAKHLNAAACHLTDGGSKWDRYRFSQGGHESPVATHPY